MYFFQITARRTSVTPAEVTALGLTTENTIMDVQIIDRDSNGNAAVIATFQHAYVRATTNKRRIAAGIRAKATTQIDLALFPDSGGEAALVGIEFPV